MNIKQLNELSISEFLAREGFMPVKPRGSVLWYISPIRAPERTPSFKVDTKINRWYDHGAGEGGKLVDLALRIYKSDDVKEVVHALNNAFSLPKAEHKFLPGVANDNSRIEILKSRALGYSHPLVAYLDSRAIDRPLASRYCEDVLFKLNDATYYAIGFKNRSGGYELRNAYFKGSSSPKDITIIHNNSPMVQVTEGFMDFLSLLKLKTNVTPKDHIILNSLSFVQRSIDVLKKYESVELLLNNDKSGKAAVTTLCSLLPQAVDKSGLYEKHNDLNNLLVSKRDQELANSKRQSKSIGP